VLFVTNVSISTAQVVDTVHNQSIGGTKTFTGAVTISTSLTASNINATNLKVTDNAIDMSNNGTYTFIDDGVSAQKEATKKMLEARDKKRAERPSVKAVKEDLKALREHQIEELKAQAVKEYQDSLVKKAISIKKKQIKKQVELDEISDDDTTLEEIRKITKKLPAKVSNPTPRSLPTPQKPAITFL